MQSDLSSWFYAEEKTMLKLLSIMILLCSIPSSIFSILQKKQIYLQLEPNEVRGVWVRSQLFIVRVEPFRLSYGKIEETRVQGSGTGSLSLKVRGRWKSVPVERGREVKELIDQRRRSLH